MSAPVCIISPTEPVQVPKPIQLPPIPRATDLASAIQAVNALSQTIQIILGQIQPSGNRGGGGGGGGGGGSNPNNPNNQNPNTNQGGGPASLGSFTVRNQVQRKVRIFQQSNPNNYIDVTQIVGLTFGNQLGQTITWAAPAGSPQ